MPQVKYIRVSPEEQNISRQHINSKEFTKVYIDIISGTIQFNERKQARNLLKDIKLGLITEVHVSSIDGLGRNILDILPVIEFLHEKPVSLFVENIDMYSMIDNKVNSAFKILISVLGNVAEMERGYLRKHQKQGLNIAKVNGTYTDRLYGTKMTEEQLLEKYKVVVKELSENNQSLRRAALLGGCSQGTAQKINRIIKIRINEA